MNYNIVIYEIMPHAEKKMWTLDQEKQAYRTFISLAINLKEKKM